MKKSAMKIIGLLFGLYLGSIMSVQAQDLSKDATSIITDSRTEVLCKSMTQSIEKESRTILILNRKGLNAAHFVCECDMFRSLQKFSGEILNASGQSVRKIKKSELQKSEYSSSLSTDDYAYYYECNFPSFPFTVKYEREIKCNNGLIGYQSFLPQTDFQQGVEQATYRIELPAGQECRYRELNTGGKNIQVTKSTGTDGQQVIEVTASKLLPIQKEPFGPDFAKLFPRIYFAPSAFKYDKSEGDMSTWQKYGEWQYKLLDGRDELTEPFRNKLHGLTAHCSTDREKVKAIYQYLKKKTLLHDLVCADIIRLDEKNQIDEKEKIQTIPQPKAFVRFIIRSAMIQPDDNCPDECWKDRTLQESYIAYTREQQKEKGLCYLTGNRETISYLHPKKIRNEGDGAKLISANDSQNFTYRGRFSNKEEAFAVGSETSQKMHNTLKWLIRKQGTFFHTLTLVTWESESLRMPAWEKDTDTIGEEYESSLSSWDDEEEIEIDENPISAREFYQALRGYGKRVNQTSMMYLLGFDAATPGRLAMVEDKALNASQYLENIKKWHEECGWLHKKEGKKDSFYGMVGVRDIANILYGTENKGALEIIDENGKKLYAEVARRLLPCIWNGQHIPYDYVQKAVDKASMPLCYKERKNWERVLTLACSMVKKQRKEKNKEEWSVALDRQENGRDYLYGRLLAVADRIEYSTYDEKDNGRITNAKRYMSTFSQRPFDTWLVIEQNIQPYLDKLKRDKIKQYYYYQKELDEILNLFEVDTFRKNERLNGLYLLGFHSESYEMRKKKQNTENKDEEE